MREDCDDIEDEEGGSEVVAQFEQQDQRSSCNFRLQKLFIFILYASSDSPFSFSFPLPSPHFFYFALCNVVFSLYSFRSLPRPFL